MMIKRELPKEAVANEPWQVWNAFIDLLAMEDYKNLTPTQQVAQLAFWYDSEIQNGGHLQFFENRGTEHLESTIVALEKLGATAQQKILTEAGKKWSAEIRSEIESVEDYVSEALEAEFEDSDNLYYECDPSINDFLEKYLDTYKGEFISFK